jgi:iron complex outermembrane receptor protein
MDSFLALDRRRGAAAPGFHRTVALLAALLLPAGTAALAEPPEDEESAQRDDGGPIVIEERLTVTDTRLRSEPESLNRVPAHVTVIDRDEIRRSGSRTLQDLLAREAGVVTYDQVGNDLGKSFDLRGFTGSGTKLFLDGVPLNDPRSNALVLELVPLAALERVEITRGSTAAVAGGGAEAGVVNLWTGRPGAGGSLALAAGGFGSRELAGDVRRQLGRADLFLAGSLVETDGFRDNSAGELRRLAGKLGWDLGGGRRLELSVVDAREDLGAPGALTRAELAADRARSPFNRLDLLGEGLTQAGASFQGPLGGDVGLAANLYVRKRASEILTTGRAAPLFGGFFLDSDAAIIGSTVQAERVWEGAAGRRNRLSGGLEWLDGETDARGFFTPPGDPGRIDAAGLGSDNTAERRALGLFVQSSWSPRPAWTLVGGLRYDRDEVGYVERAPEPANVAARTYAELSLRAGASWSPNDRSTVYLSFGEGFLPPTVEELFSFPLFGSNAELRPEDSRSWEVGARRRLGGGGQLEAAAFRIDTRDEIVFDPGSPIGLFGANVNAGSARRSGVEATLSLPLGDSSRLYANLTLMDSELRSGPNRGAALPLVPGERLAAGFEGPLGDRLRLRLDALWVGEQVLDNDEANSQARLDAYAVVNARLAWSPPFGGGTAGGEATGPVLFVEARNLLDESYESRGIFAFDFAAGRNDVFLTPAPGRQLMTGLEWGF